MSTTKEKEHIVKQPQKTRKVLDARDFVKEYQSNGHNATKAVMALEPTVSSVGVAAVKGGRMLRKDTVQALLEGTAEVAKSKLDQFVRDDLNPKQFEALKLALAYKYGTPVARSESTNLTVTVEDLLKAE